MTTEKILFKRASKHVPQLASFIAFLVHVVLNRIRRHDAMAKTNEDLQLDWRLQFIKFVRLQLLNYLSRLRTQNAILSQTSTQHNQ